jgi:hypothetical protein
MVNPLNYSTVRSVNMTGIFVYFAIGLKNGYQKIISNYNYKTGSNYANILQRDNHFVQLSIPTLTHFSTPLINTFKRYKKKVNRKKNVLSFETSKTIKIHYIYNIEKVGRFKC